jgi:hypothetical protein
MLAVVPLMSAVPWEVIIIVGVLHPICVSGLDLVWRIYMGSPEERVADLLRERLLTMYYCGRGYPTKNCHVYRNALVT